MLEFHPVADNDTSEHVTLVGLTAVYGTNGACSSSQPLATSAGLSILQAEFRIPSRYHWSFLIVPNHVSGHCRRAATQQTRQLQWQHV
jgi:hypothetical protein